MPFYPRLIDLLIAAPHRVNPDGMIQLTPAEAAMFCACDFPTVAPGLWHIPPLPAHAAPDWLFRVLPQLTRATPQLPPPTMPPMPVTPLRSPAEMTLADRSRERVQDGLRRPDHRRILEALLRRPDAPIERRRFQRALHRLNTPAFAAALRHLIATGLVKSMTHDGLGCLLLPADVRALLHEARIGVRRPVSAPTMRQRERHRRVSERTKSGEHIHRSGRRRYQRRRIPSRYEDPHGWALSSLGRLGGLRSQQAYRMRGVTNPTEPATRARMANHRRRQHQQRQPHWRL